VRPCWAALVGTLVGLVALAEGLFGRFAIRLGRLLDASWLRVSGWAVVLGAITLVALGGPAAVLYALAPPPRLRETPGERLLIAAGVGYCCEGPLLGVVLLCVFVQTFAAVGEVRSLARAAGAPPRGLLASLLSVLPARPALRWAGLALAVLYPVVVTVAFYLAWPTPPTPTQPPAGTIPVPGSAATASLPPTKPVADPGPTGPEPVPPAPVAPGPVAPPAPAVSYRTLSGLSGTVSAVAYSSDGKYVAGGCGAFYSPFTILGPPTGAGMLAVWDATGGEKPLWTKSATDQGDKCSVGGLTFTRAGTVLWAGYTADRGLDFSGRTKGRVYAWDWKRDDLVHRRDGELAAVAPDEKYAVVTHYLNGTVRWLRGTDMAEAGYCVGPKSAAGSYPQRVNLVALDPPRNRVAISWGYEKAPPSLGVADVSLGTGSKEPPPPAVVETGGDGHLALAFAPDGRLVLVGRDGQVSVWDGSGPPRKRFQTDVDPNAYNRLRVSPDGGRVALHSRNGFVCLWDLETGKKAATIDTGAAGRPWAFEFRPDGGELAIGTERGAVVLWPLR
jgi:hypothetical protein